MGARPGELEAPHRLCAHHPRWRRAAAASQVSAATTGRSASTTSTPSSDDPDGRALVLLARSRRLGAADRQAAAHCRGVQDRADRHDERPAADRVPRPSAHRSALARLLQGRDRGAQSPRSTQGSERSRARSAQALAQDLWLARRATASSRRWIARRATRRSS